MSTPAELKSHAQQKMGQSIENLKQNFAKLRTGRANPALLEAIGIDYYGSVTPLKQVANVVVTDARTLSVQVWEKSMVAMVEKAIRESGLGLNPAAAGTTVRVPMPPMTEERRRDLAKIVKSEGEDAKVGVRNARRDANDGLKKLTRDKLIGEDEERRHQDEVQKFTDRHISEIERLVADKEKELLTV